MKFNNLTVYEEIRKLLYSETLNEMAIKTGINRVRLFRIRLDVKKEIKLYEAIIIIEKLGKK
jgi:hypothetical protein